jgi:hypothetical protein
MRSSILIFLATSIVVPAVLVSCAGTTMPPGDPPVPSGTKGSSDPDTTHRPPVVLTDGGH